MIALLLFACAEPKDTGDTSDDGADDTGEPVATAPCAPWLPNDVAGTGWTYVDDAGEPAYAATASGERDWAYGTAIAVEFEYYAAGAAVQTGADFYTCTDEGLALVGSDVVYDGSRYVTFVDPPALWLPTDLTVGTAWSADSETVMDTYDADGTPIDRAGGFVTWEAEVTGEAEVTVPAGTFASLVVDFGPGVTMTYARGVGLLSTSDGGAGVSLSSFAPP